MERGQVLGEETAAPVGLFAEPRSWTSEETFGAFQSAGGTCFRNASLCSTVNASCRAGSFMAYRRALGCDNHRAPATPPRTAQTLGARKFQPPIKIVGADHVRGEEFLFAAPLPQSRALPIHPPIVLR